MVLRVLFVWVCGFVRVLFVRVGGWVGVRVLFMWVCGLVCVRAHVHMCVSARPKPKINPKL